jgi:hypothetical protein
MGHLQTRKKNTSKQEKNTSKQEKNTSKQEKTPTNKKNTNKQEKHLSSKGYLPIKCKSLQVVGISGQGKAVVSDGG